MKTFILSIILFPSCLVLADSYYVLPPEMVDKNPTLAMTIQRLISAEIVEAGEVVTLDPTTADWSINSSLLNLGRSYIMNISKSNAKETVFADNLKAATLDDIDVVIDRLVRASIQNVSAAKTQTIDSVTQDERNGARVKMDVERQFYLGFGPGAANNLGAESAGVSWLFGYLWGLQDRVGLRLNLEGLNVSDSRADMISFGVGTQYYFNKRQNSAYILGLLNYTWAGTDSLADPSCNVFCDNISDNGWGGTLGLGHHFFRTSSVNFATELSYTQGFYKIFDKSPNMFSFRVILFW